MKHYCFLLLPEYSNLCLFNALEPLRAANSFLPEQGYQWSLASLDGQPVKSSSGMDIAVNYSLDELIKHIKPDALLVLASYNYRRHSSPRVIKKLQLAKHQIRLLGGLDSGSYPLAKAGLLNGYKATIHWAEMETFKEQFHKVDVLNHRYVIDRNRISAGGATTTLDLMLVMIRQDFGTLVGLAVSELLIYDTERSESTPQRQSLPARIEQTAPRLAKAVRLMEIHIETPLSMPELTNNIGISERQLERDFKKHLQCSAFGYYTRIRLNHAHSLLKESNLSVTEIGIRAGYASRSTFIRSYKKIYGKCPSDERRT